MSGVSLCGLGFDVQFEAARSEVVWSGITPSDQECPICAWKVYLSLSAMSWPVRSELGCPREVQPAAGMFSLSLAIGFDAFQSALECLV